MSKVEVGDLIGIDGSTGYNHGCQDSAIAYYIGDGKAKVLESTSCHSCWQVGHDQEHTFLTEGEIIDVPLSEIKPNEQWATTVKWEW